MILTKNIFNCLQLINQASKDRFINKIAQYGEKYKFNSGGVNPLAAPLANVSSGWQTQSIYHLREEKPPGTLTGEKKFHLKWDEIKSSCKTDELSHTTNFAMGSVKSKKLKLCEKRKKTKYSLFFCRVVFYTALFYSAPKTFAITSPTDSLHWEPGFACS